ncbi:MAG: DNA mismatch repair endonuclease MutL [Flavobacteriales bacterium]|nr:DNA mismatch repair endonuclease MutL [Flavobacteriales bacterium]
MNDVIRLLPDSVANQIAAGEVVQRPASVVKELMENSIDAGARLIELVVKDGGRTLIQVVDNGTGMSTTDARLSLERHATSKIRKTDDLFHITTMGFRGEAIASIVAIAQCELKTKLEDEDLGTRIVVEGSIVKKQENCNCPKGTSISVKNLFFNVPARRKFLKSNTLENKHIIDQFERVALINPHVGFILIMDDTSVFHLESGTLRQRIVAIFGKKMNDRLVPVFEESNIINLGGFIGKPESSKKTRGEQYLFVNGRFVKSNYLHHAVQAAYDGLIPNGCHPSYFLTLDCAPAFIDINIHPTKTEIKFEDERSVYAILFSTIKKALGEHNIVPSLDFERETVFDSIDANQTPVEPIISVNKDFNPFNNTQRSQEGNVIRPSKHFMDGYQSFFSTESKTFDFETNGSGSQVEQKRQATTVDSEEGEETLGTKYMQLHNKYIVSSIKSGMIVIDQQRAHERILFEQYLNAMNDQLPFSQQSLFPTTVEVNAQDSALINELLAQFKSLGFDMEEFGKNSFIVRGVPMGSEQIEVQQLIESMLQDFKENHQELGIDKQESLALSLATKNCIKSGRKMKHAEISDLVDRLFACNSPYITPRGKAIICSYGLDELTKQFG